MSEEISNYGNTPQYYQMPITPIEFIQANNLNFAEGCVVKYISRHRRKNGRADLEKARHYIDLLIEHEYPIADVEFENE